MKAITAYAIVDKDGDIVIHTVRATRHDAIEAFEELGLFWVEVKDAGYRSVKVEISEAQ